MGDSLFRLLDSARLSVDNLKAMKLAKSGDTVEGACDRAIDFLLQNGKGRVWYQVEGVVLMAGTSSLRNSGELFICKIPSKLDLAFVDSKIAHYNDLLSLDLKLSNVLLIETINRELKFFNHDELHLNK